jgi:hypothetical protein
MSQPRIRGGGGRGQTPAWRFSIIPPASDILKQTCDPPFPHILSTQPFKLCGMEKVVVNLRLDRALVERIDAAAGPRQRTKWMVRAFELHLRGVPHPEAPVVAERPRAVRSQVVRASSLVTRELESEWDVLMRERQARLNRQQATIQGKPGRPAA